MTAKTGTTITDREALVDELANIRAQKFAIDNEESEEGVRCLDAPILDHNVKALAAVSLSGPAYRLSISRLIALSTLVMDTAKTISGRLGYAAQN